MTRTAAAHPAGAHRPRHDEDGFVTAEWVLGLVVLVVPVLLLVAILPSWAAQREAAGAAAREAARTVAAAPAAGTAGGVEAASRLLAGRGQDPADAEIIVTIPPGAPRVGTVTASVTLPGRRALVPLFGRITGPPATAVHVRQLDPHRSRP